MNRVTALPVYPFLLALYPVVALYAHNSDQLLPDSLLLPCAIAVGMALLVLLVMRWICGSYRAAGIPTAVFIGAFFSYGHIHTPLRRLWPGQVMLSGLLLYLVMAVLVLVAVLIVRPRARGGFGTGTMVLNIVGVFLLVIPLARIIQFESQAPRPPVFEEAATVASATEQAGDDAPNILFLVPDRYPSESTLIEIYDYDNSDFLDSLRALGFYVADESRCNYGRTDMSLASALNMKYLDGLMARVGPASIRRALYWAIQDSRVIGLLTGKGYRYLHFGTSWHATARGRKADENYNHILLPEFSMMLYRTTAAYPAGAYFGFDGYREQWQRVHYKFDMLEILDTVPGPVFVFAHFLLPHEPYVLDRDGGYVSYLEQAGRGVEPGFIDQLVYCNKRILTLVDRLTRNDDARPWVIILQSDEGPHPPENFQHRDSLQTLQAKFRILNALYLPGADTSRLYSDISSVNTFRFILDSYFGTDFGFLPDRSFVVRNGNREEVTEKIHYQSAGQLLAP